MRLLGRLGRALHRYGTPAHRLEEALVEISRRLGVPAQFFSTPTAFFASFDRAGTTLLTRTEPGDVDLGRLAELDSILDDLTAGRTKVAEAVRRVDALEEERARRLDFAAEALAYAVASASAARFFGGGWRELAVAAASGGLVATITRLARRSPGRRRIAEPVSAFLVSALVVAAAHVMAPLSVPVATLAGLIVLLPGLTLTIAMTELSTRHLVSGTARLTGAVATTLTLVFGVALGTRLATLAFGELPLATPWPLPAWTLLAALAVAPLAFLLLFRARPADAPWILAAGVVGFAGARAGAHLLGPELGTLAGAVLVGVFGNVYANGRHGPASVPIVPGVMLLVPGSLGFESLTSFVANDPLGGVEAAFRAALVAAALATGFLVANVLVPPRRAL
ncbi:MAG: threonine/serine exporter family protein [Gemmatimonadetes bacterium]|nr:threonine/serine exporter family protein [Gemmatimonadota bacterium]